MVSLRGHERCRAVDFVDRAEDALRQLEEDPDAGAEVRLGGRPGGGAHASYRFFYRVRNGDLWILAMSGTGDSPDLTGVGHEGRETP